MRLLVAAVVVATATGSASAAPRPGHVAFRSYGADDGLAALDVVAGTQDREGFIWAASTNGLFRFDGVRFRKFSLEAGLPSLLITDMATGPDGVLWGATSRGAFFQRGDRFVALGTDVLPVDGMHLLGFDRAGRTWVTTDTGPFTMTIEGAVEPVAGWPGGASFGLLIEGDDVWISHDARLLHRAAGAATFADVGHDFGDTITHVIRDGRGRLWARAGQHLWMQPAAGTPFEERSRLDGATVGPTNVRLAVGATGNLLVPTANGLVEIDGDEARLVPTDLPPDARNVKTVWLDREGAMWLTSLGLHHELGRGLWRTMTVAEGLPSNVVWDIVGLQDGRVAVGTDAGVALVGASSVERISDQMIMGMLEQPAGTLWIATTVLEQHDLATGGRRTITAVDGWTDGAPTSLAADEHGSLWVGVDRGGLYRAGPGPVRRFERVALSGGDGARVWSLAADGDRLWVTTSAGLFLHEPAGWRRFTRADGLHDDGLTFITVRRNRDVCVSYLAPVGATCLRYAGGTLTAIRHLDEASGLTSPMPYFLEEDAHGRLWVGGALGVSILDGRRVDHFTRGGGAPGDDCNAGSSWVAPSGDVWIGTSTGLGVFATDRYTPAAAPTVVLERGKLGGKPLDVEGWRAPVTRHVPYGRGDLDVEFAVLSFLDPHQLEYQVKLIGFDDDWRAVEGRDARYHRLPAGEYRFTARARYHGGRWGEATSFAFVVATPWWQTWWFRGLAVVGLIAAGVGLARWRSRALVARNLELEGVVRERTAELVKANAQIAQAEKLSALGRLLAQLSHEINNPLNVIHNNLGPLEEYQQTLTAAVESCRDLVATRSGRIAIDELWQRLDLQYVIEDSGPAFASTRHAIDRIATIHRELRTFLRGEPPERDLLDLGPGLRATVTMFARAHPLLDLRCTVPPLPALLVNEGRIQQTVINLLQNAVDAVGTRGRIDLEASADATHVRVRISDTGPGVPAAVRARIFEPFFTTKDVGKGLGLGLAICREIIVAHGGTLELASDSGPGACFVISLPLPVAARRAA